MCQHTVNARLSRKQKSPQRSPVTNADQKLEGLRNRANKSAIEAAIELRAKRDIPAVSHNCLLLPKIIVAMLFIISSEAFLLFYLASQATQSHVNMTTAFQSDDSSFQWETKRDDSLFVSRKPLTQFVICMITLFIFVACQTAFQHVASSSA